MLAAFCFYGMAGLFIGMSAMFGINGGMDGWTIYWNE